MPPGNASANRDAPAPASSPPPALLAESYTCHVYRSEDISYESCTLDVHHVPLVKVEPYSPVFRLPFTSYTPWVVLRLACGTGVHRFGIRCAVGEESRAIAFGIVDDGWRTGAIEQTTHRSEAGGGMVLLNKIPSPANESKKVQIVRTDPCFSPRGGIDEAGSLLFNRSTPRDLRGFEKRERSAGTEADQDDCFFAALRESTATPMQLTSALLRPQIMPAAPVPSAKPNLWILSSWRDLLLYVGTPLLLIPLFAVAQARWSAQDIYVFVAAFGATGHHLPGMIRAYGDPAVFQRFKWRFIFAPIFLLAICVAFTWWDLKGILLIVFFWGVWHGMMQTYGFCRIYDAKVGSFAAITRRLDFALCAVWFAAAVFLSSERMADTLEAYYASGAPQIPFGVLHQGQQIVLGIAIAVAVLFVANFARSWIVGKRPNPVKLALLGTSIAFWWFCNNGVTNILAGIALFEVFHDVQYLSLVWIYNRNRVEKDSSIGGFMRFIFRRSGSLIGLYIGLVFAYGMLGYFKERAEIDLIKRALTGLVAASGLLHFYYDGFIWKVRDRSTRESLGLSGGAVSLASNQIIPGWFLHGLKWGGIFVVPLTVLWIGQLSGPAPQVQREGWIVENFPSIASQRFHHAESLVSAGQLDLAAQEYRVGLSIDPKEEKAHYGLGHLLFALSKPEEGTQHLKEAVELDPKNAEFRADYGYALEHLGQKSEAASYYESALQLDPKSARVHYGYAMFLAQDGQIERALPEFEAAVRIKPDYTDAHYDLATALSLRGDLEGAKIHYLETARLSPKRSEPHNNLGVIYLREKQFPQAVAHLSQAVRLEPANNTAANNLKQAQALLAASDANNSNPR